MTTKNASQQSSLRRRIRRFYELLSERQIERCHQMLDPRIREQPTSVTFLQYDNSARDFLAAVGAVEVREIELELHVNEANKLYENRDFAVGQTRWIDEHGTEHVFQERWVREGRRWYTRSTGFVLPRERAAPARS